ncbi:MAG: hypothetical protein KC621_02420 [Myxococcales bacterium]|nr:hypothetical protein [Myxococcales bacterium]
MAVIINDFELLTEPEETRSNDRTRPNGEAPRAQERPPSPRDVMDVIEWERDRAQRMRAH